MNSLNILKSYQRDSEPSTDDDNDTSQELLEETPMPYEYKELKSHLAIAINPTPLVEISVSESSFIYLKLWKIDFLNRLMPQTTNTSKIHAKISCLIHDMKVYSRQR